MVRVSLAVIAFMFAAAPAASHQTPGPANAATSEIELAKPPASGTQILTISSPGGSHGKVVRWTAPDGTVWARESLLLRGFKTELDQQARLAADGSIREFVVRGTTPSGDASESFKVTDGRWTYSSPVDKGEAAAKAGAAYVPYGGLFAPNILLAEALYKAPGRSLDLAPSGRATLTPLTALEVEHGGQKKKLTAFTIDGISLSPVPIWFEGDKVFGSVSFLNFLPQGWEPVVPRLSKAQDDALAQRAPALARQDRAAPDRVQSCSTMSGSTIPKRSPSATTCW